MLEKVLCYLYCARKSNPKSGERKAIFKKAEFDRSTGQLYVKDKAAGGLNFDVGIDTYKNNGNIYIVNAIINKKPDNVVKINPITCSKMPPIQPPRV